MLGEELKKPAKKRNYDKIEELTGAYAELMGTETEVGNAMQRCLLELKSKARPKRKIMKNGVFVNFEHNLTEIQVNGRTAILAEEKKI